LVDGFFSIFDLNPMVLFTRLKKASFILIILVLITLPLGCKKFALEFIGGAFADEIWEDRPAGIACSPSSSPNTISQNELTFSPNRMLCISITMDDDAFDRMRNESRFGPSIKEKNGATASAVLLEYLGQCGVPFPKEYNWYNADILVDGIQLKNVGIRKKGFLGSIFSVAPALKINTDRNQAGQSIANTKRITLNNNSEDPTRIIQCFNYKVFELAGYPAPRCNLANVSVNNEALGVYSHIEAINQSFLERSFGNSNGALYEGQLVDFVEDWTLRWDAKTDQTPNIANPLRTLSKILSTTSDNDLPTELSKHLNIDQFISFWALEIILGHNDGYCSNRNNFFVYQNPTDQNRAVLIPWGLNYIQEDDKKNTLLKDFVGAQIPRRLSRIPAYRDSLSNRIKALLNSVWDEAFLTNYIDGLALQVKSGQSDAGYDQRVAELKVWVQNRKADILGKVNAGIPTGSEKDSKKCYQNDN